MIHPSQVEEKYGGTAENLTEYWPPKKISDEYGYDPNFIVETDTSQGKVSNHQNFFPFHFIPEFKIQIL